MIPLHQILGCTNCGNVFHIHLSNRQHCPHCGYRLNHAQKLEWKI